MSPAVPRAVVCASCDTSAANWICFSGVAPIYAWTELGLLHGLDSNYCLSQPPKSSDVNALEYCGLSVLSSCLLLSKKYPQLKCIPSSCTAAHLFLLQLGGKEKSFVVRSDQKLACKSGINHKNVKIILCQEIAYKYSLWGLRMKPVSRNYWVLGSWKTLVYILNIFYWLSAASL